MLEGKRQAIIVGINEYLERNIPKLRGAENDAKEIYFRLNDPDIGNFRSRVLVGQDATVRNIRGAISEIFWQTDQSDLVLFYFSGHGFADGYGDAYLAPFDMVADEPYICGISMAELNNIVSRSQNKAVILILDCCYSGVATTKGHQDMEPFKTPLENVSGRNKIIFASAQDNVLAREVLTFKHANDDNPHAHGNFTGYLIDGLDGGASNSQGLISIESLRYYVEKKMEITKAANYDLCE